MSTDSKYTIEDVAQYVASEGLGYAVQHGLGADAIEDEQLAKLWKQAKEALKAIDAILPDEDGES